MLHAAHKASRYLLPAVAWLPVSGIISSTTLSELTYMSVRAIASRTLPLGFSNSSGIFTRIPVWNIFASTEALCHTAEEILYPDILITELCCSLPHQMFNASSHLHCNSWSKQKLFYEFSIYSRAHVNWFVITSDCCLMSCNGQWRIVKLRFRCRYEILAYLKSQYYTTYMYSR